MRRAMIYFNYLIDQMKFIKIVNQAKKFIQFHTENGFKLFNSNTIVVLQL